MPPVTRPYHHGDLRPALLRAAVATITEAGATAMSLREVARRAGVTHAAAAYHFGDKAGLFTAVAVEGYRELGEALREAARRGFLEMGVAYVRFAVTHRAHFEVMYRPELYHPDAGRRRGAPLRHRQPRRRAAGRRGRGVVAGPRAGHALAERQPTRAAWPRPGGDHPHRRPPPERRPAVTCRRCPDGVGPVGDAGALLLHLARPGRRTGGGRFDDERAIDTLATIW